MHDLKSFHRLMTEFLEQIGFETPVLSATQEVMSIEIEARFTVHLCLIDQIYWSLVAEIMPTDINRDAENYSLWLQNNQVSTNEYQPVIALDSSNQLICWLRLPLHGCTQPQMIAAFDAILNTAYQLLKYE